MLKKSAIYIHYPFCISKCPYCDFNSHVWDNVDYSAFRQAYIKEIEFSSKLIDQKSLEIDSLYFGGGTPTLMPVDLVETIMINLQKNFRLADDIEITLEANPSSVEVEKFARLKDLGINRVSIGVQSFDEEELKFLGRQHSVNEARAAIEHAQKYFDKYSFDLIYALPGQSVKGWEGSLKKAMSVIHSHVSLYQLTIEKGTAFYGKNLRREFTMPNEDLKADLYQRTEEIIEQHGLKAYEVSNYAKSGHESRHNLHYWQYDQYLGIGAGSHSRIHSANHKISSRMLINDPQNWLNAIMKSGDSVQQSIILSQREAIEEMIMLCLRNVKGINKPSMYKLLGVEFDDVFSADIIQTLVDEKLVINNQDSFVLTFTGRMVTNAIMTYLIDHMDLS